MKEDFSLAVGLAESVRARPGLLERGLETYEGASNDPDCYDRGGVSVYWR